MYVFLVLAGSTHALAANGTEWVRLTPATSPSARAGMAMAYDAAIGKVVLFGGLGPNLTYLADTWTFDGVTWTQLNPPASPPARTAAAMAYDAPTGKLVMFGGFTEAHGYFGDTWIFDSSAGTWTAANPTTSPTAVTAPSLFTDPLTGQVDNYGGFDGMFYQLNTWQWTGTNWLQLHPAATPTARGAAATAFDHVHHNVVLFGGLGDVNPYNTWTWDGVNWTEQSPAAQPPLLYNAGAAYDPGFRLVILFGGGTGGVDQNATWAWTGSNWVEGHPTKSPSPRESMGVVNDQTLGRVILFGGLSGNKFFNDTWQIQPQ